MSTATASTAPPLPGAEQSTDSVAAPVARVSFRQPVTTDPHMDGAWWPRSRDLEAELPGLLDVLWTSCRDVDRVSYPIHSWQPAPRRLRVDGREVRLGGFTHQDASVISLRDGWGTERIDVLVIPPDTDPAIAAAAMKLASQGGPNERAARMFAAASSTPGGTRETATA